MPDRAPIKVGFIGTGGNARWHMGTVLSIPDYRVVGLADPNPAMLHAAKKQHAQLSDVPAFSDWREMLDELQLDAVEISTPHTTHHEQIVAALDKGLNVLCEKPLVCTVAHAKDVIARLAAAGKVGLLSYQRHYQPEFRWIREKIASGAFGKVTFISALQCQGWKTGVAGSWRQDPALSGGGQLNDSGSHLIDIILWITGLKVETVSAYIDNCGTPVDINSAVALRFDGGAQATLSIVGDAPDWHEDVTIWCEGGVFFMRNGKLQVADNNGRYTFDNLRGGSTPDRNFADAILGRDQVQSPFECGLRVIELTEAAWKSAAQGSAPVAVG